MLGFPLVRLVTLSLQKFGLKQQFGAAADWVGLDNFRDDPVTTTSSGRCCAARVVFCAVNVGADHAFGMAIALLLNGSGRRCGC